MRQPFVLRSPNGPNAGKYVRDFDHDDIKILWADGPADAKRFDVPDAYSLVAAAIDMCCEVVQPENAGDATEEECIEFGRVAARDMFQNPGEFMLSLFEKWAVRAASDPLPPLPEEWMRRMTTRENGYMSVWEWFGRTVVLRYQAAKESQ